MRLAPLAVTMALLLALGLGAGTVVATDGPDDTGVDDVDAAVDVYNEHVDEAPDVLRDRAADERVTLTLERQGEADEVYTVVTDEDAKVTSIEEGADDPTVQVRTDEATLDEIAESDDPAGATVDAYESDRIEVEGVGVTNTVIVEATKAGYAVASRLGVL